jgi:hypothetical protein
MNVTVTPVSPTGSASIVRVDPVASWTPEQAATGSFHCRPATRRRRAVRVTGEASYPQVADSDLTGLLAAR